MKRLILILLLIPPFVFSQTTTFKNIKADTIKAKGTRLYMEDTTVFGTRTLTGKQILNVDGAVKIGASAKMTPGTIQYKSGYFWGYGLSDSTRLDSLGGASSYLRNVKDYGATGDGSTDDSDAIQACFDVGSGYITIGESIADTFILNKSIEYTGDNLTIEINGVVKMIQSDTVLLKADVDSLDMRVVVANAGNYFEVGQRISVSDDNMEEEALGNETEASFTYRRADPAKITAIDTDTIFLNDTLKHDLKVVDNAIIGLTQPNFIIKGRNISFCGNGVVDNNWNDSSFMVYPVRVPTDLGDGVLTNCVIFGNRNDETYYGNISFRDLTFQNGHVGGIYMYYPDTVSFDNVKFNNHLEKATSFRYGLHLKFNNCTFDNVRYNDGIGLYLGCDNTVIDGCRFTDCNRSGVNVNATADSVIVRNSEFIDCGRSVWVVGTAVDRPHMTRMENLRVTNVRQFIDNGRSYGIYLYYANEAVVDNVIVTGNTVAEGGILIAGHSENITIRNSTIRDFNYVSNGVGIYILNVTTDVPDSIRIENTQILNNRLPFNVATATNIEVINCGFDGNTFAPDGNSEINYTGSTGLANTPFVTDSTGTVTLPAVDYGVFNYASFDYIVLNPQASPPPAAKGTMYTNSNGLLFHHNGLYYDTLSRDLSDPFMSDEMWAIYSEFDTRPTYEASWGMDTLLYTLDTAGIWGRLDCFYLFANASSANAIVNWKDPTGTDATLSATPPTFTAYKGFQGNGNSSAVGTMYINTNFNPNTATHYQKDSCAIGIAIQTNLTQAVSGNCFGCTDSTAWVRLINRNTSNQTTASCNSTNNAQVVSSITDGAGYFSFARIATATYYIYNDKSSTTATRNSVADPNANLYLLAFNTDGPASAAATTLYDSDQISCFWAGSYMSAAQITIIVDAIERYLDAVGYGLL